ncbi:MAG: type I DNA topoisomerase [Erysipelotrichaceae bacterium]|nr:type I DNA topoisomerase [Erysipelotrichaceae bacterium]
MSEKPAAKEKKNLVIVESPSKAKTIEKYLGSNYEVASSKGHITNLATTGKEGLGVDIENEFKPTYVIDPDKKQVVRELKNLVKNSDKVYLATDPDREGEAIAWHLANELNLDLNDQNRIVFHEVTKPAVNEAIRSPRQVDMNLVSSQEGRRILDRIIGFKLSVLLRNKIKSRSAGRVQSVALKLIVEREREIEAFNPEEYWTISGIFKKSRSNIEGELSRIDGAKAEIRNEADAMAIKDACENQQFEVREVTEEIKKRKPRLPYTTSTLQQDAANKLFFSSKKTMQIAQRLYEGKDVGNGLTGLITYMRSDSNRLSDVFMASTKDYIVNNYGKEYAGYYHAKVDKNAQDAHEAIRPTDINNTPEKIKNYLTNDEYKLYRLIYYRALAALMSDSTYKSVTAILGYDRYEFTASGRQQIFDGYLKAYGEFESSEDKKLPELTKGEILPNKSVTPKQHFTEPPLRYSEARLIKALEENGIGRPSTYATIIDTIVERDYVTLEKSTDNSKVKVFKPTEQGILTNDKLAEFFSSIINVKYTSQMEKDLDEIAEGKARQLDVLTEFYDSFVPLLDNAKANMEKLQPEKTGEICPECGSELVIRKGRFGKFISCSNYPSCKYTRPLENQEKKEEQQVVEGRVCPQCGKPLVTRKGRYGSFIGCSGYPECNYIEKKEKDPAKETGELCPECGHPLVVRKSRYGTEFIACSNYPKCRYIKKDASRPKTVRKSRENAEG